ncbi:hypothetical protein N0B44_23470 [Roseibacterium beibuensis]|uniref:Secreted protein n=1 Tax=[Roseibacterium] beibuensis TaxID=1193142 RepID=A0ABP9LLZ2_9RHOB|nr:hypothetical protein [Roseibacterium beibuensis]MCS6625880.1 hypothetical protein [Roseibacterium beibuensis]
MSRLPAISTAAALLAAVAASPLRADCATAADLAAGIRVDFDNGGFWLMRATDAPDTLIAFFTWELGTPGQSVEMGRGIYPLRLQNDGSDEVIAFTYDPSYATAPPPAPGVVWEVMETDGTRPPEPSRYEWRAAAPLVLGECSYDLLELSQSQTLSGQRLETDFIYFTALGFAVMLEQRLDGRVLAALTPTAVEVME